MSWYKDDHAHKQAHEEYQTASKHEATLSHELIAGAAAFEAAKAYQAHCAKNGQPPSHETAKNLIAGFAGAFIDREFETHGLDYIDKQKAKRQAEKHTHEAVQQYGGY